MTEREAPRIDVFHALDSPEVDLEQEDVRLRNGERLTDDVVDELVEAGRRVAGRPSLGEDGGHSPRWDFRLPAELNDQLQAVIEQQGRSRSEVAREALEAWLQRHRGAA